MPCNVLKFEFIKLRRGPAFGAGFDLKVLGKANRNFLGQGFGSRMCQNFSWNQNAPKLAAGLVYQDKNIGIGIVRVRRPRVSRQVFQHDLGIFLIGRQLEAGMLGKGYLECLAQGLKWLCLSQRPHEKPWVPLIRKLALVAGAADTRLLH